METSREAIDFIDAWLVEHGSFVDQRTVDFALDLRLIIGSRGERDGSMGITSRVAA